MTGQEARNRGVSCRGCFARTVAKADRLLANSYPLFQRSVDVHSSAIVGQKATSIETLLMALVKAITGDEY